MALFTALAIGAGIAGSIAGGVLAKKGAESQASAAERASALAVAEQRRQYDVNRQDLMPWITAGTQAVQMLQFLLGLGVPPQQAAQTLEQAVPGSIQNIQRLQEISGRFGEGGLIDIDGREDGGVRRGGVGVSIPGGGSALTPSSGGGSLDPSQFGSLMRDFGLGDFETDPGYDFRLAEGAKALERSAAARGGLFSGGTAKALTRYNQDFASNEFSNAYNRFQTNRATRYNQLAGLAGLGQTTAQTLAGLGTQSANNIANTTIAGMTSAAAARASGYNAIGNAIGNAANVPLNWLLLSRLNAQGSGSSSA